MNTKWNLFLVIIVCASLLLSACSSAGSTPQATGAAGSDQGSTATQLALGMFKLESSAYPVDAEEAAALLPLWKAARALGKSDSTADAEVSALTNQIQSSLTAEQLQVIQSMTAAEMSQIAQEQGLTLGGAGMAAGTSAEPSAAEASAGATAGGMGAPGGMMGGGDPGMMGGAPGGGSASTSAAGSTSQAGSFDGVSTAILNAIITSLQTKVA